MSYIERHRGTLEQAIAQALTETIQAESADPIRAIAARLLSLARPYTAPPERTEPTPSGGAGGGGGGEAEAEQWSAEAWLASLALHTHVAAALRPALHMVADPFEWVRTSLDERSLVDLLGAAGLEGLVTPVLAGAQSLRSQGASGAGQLNAKFAAEGGTFEMAFGSLQQFHGGLEGLVGPPRFHEGSLRGAMSREHCNAADSDAPFSTSNGIEGARSSIEWEFVVAPAHAVLHGLAETHYVERGRGFRDANPEWCRRPRPLAELQAEMERCNARLTAKRHAPLVLEEVIAGRLYTGPMYEKYNAVLRACSGAPPLVARAESLCLGNRYPTTLHAINSCVLKLAKLTVISRVYRGFAGATLPAAFWAKSDEGVAGGVEFAFMSTTKDRSQAAYYAGDGRAPTVIEMEQGMVDRGAELSWLSQYPHEDEVLFGPLTGLEVLRSRVAGSTLALEVRLSLNQKALTLEQVVGKRHKLLREMGDGVCLELRAGFDEHVGCWPGVKCWSTGVEPIVGARYRHLSFFGIDLCEEAFDALPAEGETGNPTQKRSNFERMEPMSAADAAARRALAAAALGALAASAAEWCNADANYEAAVRVPVMVKTHLAARLPPMLRVLGVTAEAKAAELKLLDGSGGEAAAATSALESADADALAGLEGLRALEAVQAVAFTRNVEARIGCTGLTTVDMAPWTDGRGRGAASLAELLRLLSDPWTIHLLGRATLTRLPEAIGATLGATLETLDLSDCACLEALPESLGQLTALTSLSLQDCGRLAELPASWAGLTSLLKLDCTRCALLGALPESQHGQRAESVGHAGLEQLVLHDCEALRTLPACWGTLPALRKMNLEGCKALGSLPPLHLPMCTHLSLARCKALTALPPLHIEMSAGASTSLKVSTCALPSLEILALRDCVKLASLPPLGTLPKLRLLHLAGCEALTELPDLSGLEALRTLYLNGCDGLTELPDVSALALDANGFSPPEHLTPAEGVGFVRLAKIGGKTIS